MNGHSNNIDTTQATEHLKTILNVGKVEMESATSKSVSNGNVENSNSNNATLSSALYQKIELNTSKDSSHIPIYGTDVDVFSSPLQSDATCSQIIVENVVDYIWEEKYYHGRLVSVHLSGSFVAYVLKVANTEAGFVRLVYTGAHKRLLIKDFVNEVKDISFAHTEARVLLGSVDSCGELYVHKISYDVSAIQCNLMIHVCRPCDWLPSEHNRVIWCLYIPEDSDNAEYDSTSDDVSSLLVVTHNERAEIWNVETIWENHGYGKITVDEVKSGVQVINEHKQPICAATFSPDGTALAIGSIDGLINFYQVQNLHNLPTMEINTSPRCLHQWTPHPKKSLSSLYFLDNYKNHRPDVQFWKIAITGAENNTELKIWSCETWMCLQTIKIHPNSGDSVMPCFKAEIDLSSKYLFLSDIKRKVLLIFLIQQESTGNVIICSISEYRVPHPVLSLGISNISYAKNAHDECKLSDDEGDSDVETFVIKLFWVQCKTLQSCRIQYNSKIASSSLCSTESIGSLSQDSFVLKDGLSDISLDSRDTSSRNLKDLDMSLSKKISGDDHINTQPVSSSSTIPAMPTHITPNYQKCSEGLLTPDDFTSPSRSHLTSQFEESPTKIDSLPVEPCTLQRRKSSQHSATSSPSREVAEILAPIKVMMHMDDEDIKIKTPVSVKDSLESLNNTLEPISLGVTTKPLDSQNYHLKEWPQAPDTSKDFLLSSRKESDLQNHRSQHFHSEREEFSTIPYDTNNKIVNLNKNIEDIIYKLDAMSIILHDHSSKIASLNVTQQEQNLGQQDSLLTGKFEHAVAQTLNPHYTRIESLVIKKGEDERKRAERDFTAMSNEALSTFGNCLDVNLKKELTNNIVPQINKVVDTIAHKMQEDFSQKLSSTDANLKDTFTKHLRGKAFTDALTHSITVPLQTILQTSCREAFQTCVIPTFEKSCHQLFKQLNELFLKGTTEYVQALHIESEKFCNKLESSTLCMKDEVNNLAIKVQETIQSQMGNVESQCMDVYKQQIFNEIHQVVAEEMRKAFREQQASRSATPVPMNDPQLQMHHLKQLVRQEKLSDAFQQALSAMDVQLVLYVCEMVSVDKVFGTIPCPLQQHVLLSLVNQLSADLSIKTDIKVKYIEDVVASLDVNNPIIREHVHGVLESLQQRISTFLHKIPNHRLARNMRRISLAINSLMKV